MSIISGIDDNDFDEFVSSIKKNKKNLKVVSKRNDNKTPFQYAIIKDRVDMVKYLIDNHKELDVTLDQTHYRGLRPVITLAHSMKMLKLLVENGFMLEIKDGASTIGAMLDSHWTSDDIIPMVEYLIQKGVRLDSYEQGSWSPFMRAVAGNQVEIMYLLADAGADINVKDWNGRTAANICPAQSKTVQALMELGVELTDKDIHNFGRKFPMELSNHKYIDKYLDKLLELGYDDALPQTAKDLFLF
jgi:ankyrin repeat protein